MKKFLLVLVLLAVAVSAASAGDFVVGSTFGDKSIKLTTFDYSVTEPLKGSWSSELGIGFATGFNQWKQTEGVKRYTLSVGLGTANKNASFSGGYVIGYVAGANDDCAYPGFYGKVDLKISKSWFAEVKYVQLFGSDVAEGWQGGIGFKF